MTVKHKYKLVWRIMLLAILSVVLLAACATKPQQVAQSTATVQQATPTPAVLPSPTALLPATVPPTSPAQATPPPPAINTPSPVAEATPATTDADPLEGQALVEALRRGGYVIFFRHARTDFSQPDSDRQNLEDCGTQRNLSEAGRADAHAIGDGAGSGAGNGATTGSVRVRAFAERGDVVIEVEDDGAGVPDELRARIWEPFFTTKPVGRGTGLGLDIARHIVVEQHGGRLTLDSRPGRTVFAVRLPAGGPPNA
jgi:hypothetical protein